MRELTGHKVNGCNDALRVVVLDEPGHGGASHNYLIEGFKLPGTLTEAQKAAGYGEATATSVGLSFQNGPIAEVGTNGVTHEALLAILIDRLQGFQAGKYACRENAIALTKLQEAQHWLQHRTHERLARGVEGSHTV